MSFYASSELRGGSSGGSNFDGGEGFLGRSKYPQREGPNGHRGPTTIELPGTGFSADIYQRASYVAERHELAGKTEMLIVESRLWTPDTAHKIVQCGLERSDPRNTSWIGFRKTDAPRGEYVGTAWQEELTIPTSEGDQESLYMKLRVFKAEAQGLRLGRLAMQLGLSVHPDAKTIWHRSGSARAVLAWLESGVFVPGRRFPRDISFIKDSRMAQMLLWIWDIYHINGEMPNLLTGVSKHDYSEPNGADPVDERYPHVMETRTWMTETLKMKVLRGDSLYEGGEVA